MRELNEAERVFLTEYLGDTTSDSETARKVRAFRIAWPNNKGKHATIVSNVNKVMLRPPVKAIVDRAIATANKKIGRVVERYAITKENIATEIAKSAFTNVGDLMSWDGQTLTLKPSETLPPEVLAAVQEVNEVVNKDGSRSIKVKLKDNRPFLELLAKHKGMLVEEKKEDKRTVVFVVEKGDGKGLEYAANIDNPKVIEGKVLSSS